MPYIRPVPGGGYMHCQPYTRGAMLVSDHTVTYWDELCALQHTTYPVSSQGGYRLRIYPEMNVASHAPFAPDGVYVDHSDPRVEQAAYDMRDRLLRQMNGSRQEVLQTIASRLGLRHWRDAYNATRNVGRRVTGESGRNTDGELVWRRWSTRYTPAAMAAAAASPYRAFGIEVEFLGAHARPGIERDFRLSGIAHHIRWSGWHREAGIPGWHCTYDSTVSGGEIISDIMDGSPTSRDEVARVLRIVRDNGGQTHANQGMHVHHDVRDFTVADRVRLVDNIAACQDALLSFVGQRRSSHWCRPMSASEFAQIRRAVASGGSGSNDHGVAWNFGHLTGRGSIEFRALGNTLNGRKVRAWVQAGQALLTATKAGHTFTGSPTVPAMLAVLRDHGMSNWASDVFAARCGYSTATA